MFVYLLIVFFICVFFLYFSIGHRQGFRDVPYMDNWNWDIKGFPGHGDPYKVETSGMDTLTPLPFWAKYSYPTYWSSVTSPYWFYDIPRYGPIEKPWGPGSRDTLVRF